MLNPFDNDDALFLVLRNMAGQHSLWPQFRAVPDGWTRVHGPDSRSACLSFIQGTWTDMRPTDEDR